MSPFNTGRLLLACIVALAVWQLYCLHNISLSHDLLENEKKLSSFLALPYKCERQAGSSLKNVETGPAFSLMESKVLGIRMEEEEKRKRCSSSSHHHHHCQQRQQRLEFVHIPKTAGFAIQHAAARVNIRWGYCHFTNNTSQQHGEEIGCPTKRNAGQTVISRPSVALLPAGVKFPVPWHLPPFYFFEETGLRHWFPHNPYKASTLFAVVRNPYSRAISEYYYRKKMGKVWINTTAINNTTVMNVWLRTHLTKMVRTNYVKVQVPSSSSPPPPDNQPGSNATTTATTTVYIPDADYFRRDGHFIPQSDYIYSYNGEHRIVDVILRYEKLDIEFPALMQRFNLTNVTLPTTSQLGRAASSSRARIQQMGIQNLTLENIRLIELVYARDFAVFGYPTVSSHFMDKSLTISTKSKG